MMNFRYPNITGRTEEEKVTQIVSFLRQLVDQLNFTISSLENGGKTAVTPSDINATQK